jgi:hypothetical protein
MKVPHLCFTRTPSNHCIPGSSPNSANYQILFIPRTLPSDYIHIEPNTWELSQKTTFAGQCPEQYMPRKRFPNTFPEETPAKNKSWPYTYECQYSSWWNFVPVSTVLNETQSLSLLSFLETVLPKTGVVLVSFELGAERRLQSVSSYSIFKPEYDPPEIHINK